jgi:Ca2+-binding EF-hand superfamily protein
MGGTPGKPGQPGAGGTGGKSSPFQQRDTNKDGKLSRDELPAALFDRLDADKDGFVSEAELAGLWKKK